LNIKLPDALAGKILEYKEAFSDSVNEKNQGNRNRPYAEQRKKSIKNHKTGTI
jgi:hypothetical protein